MDNIKKIGLTALAGSLVASSVSAATLTATGSAGMSYTGGDEKKTQGQGWTMGDSITMSASGDVNDIGVTLSFEIDNDDTGGGDVYDSHSIKFDLGDAGVLTFHGHGGSSALGAKDDVMPAAWEEPWDILAGAEANLIGGAGGDNMFVYSYAHESGLTGTVSYVNAADAVTDVSSTSYGVEYTGMEGLTLGYATAEESTVANTTDLFELTAALTGKIGNFSYGYQREHIDLGQTTAATDAIFHNVETIGLAYAINDALSVSYNTIESKRHNVAFDNSYTTKTDAINFGYTVGGITLGSVSYTHLTLPTKA